MPFTLNPSPLTLISLLTFALWSLRLSALCLLLGELSILAYQKSRTRLQESKERSETQVSNSEEFQKFIREWAEKNRAA